jgi:hypothetical protein
MSVTKLFIVYLRTFKQPIPQEQRIVLILSSVIRATYNLAIKQEEDEATQRACGSYGFSLMPVIKTKTNSVV